MAVHSPGRARACFDLKRTTYPLISLVLRTADLAEVQRELQARLGDASDFFDQDLLVLNLAALRDDDPAIDFAALVALLREYRVQPIGVHGGSPAQMEAAGRAGLVPTPEVSAATSMARSTRAARGQDETAAPVNLDPPSAPDSGGGVQARTHAPGAAQAVGVPKVEPARAANLDAAQAAEREPERGLARSPATASAAPGELPAGTLVIDKPLRSGQRVYARGADLVVLEVVSYGAEVFADGNIHVYAPLRGRAIAGARGNESARIFTTCLDPQLVAIAGVYRTTETPLPPEVAGKPAQVRRVGDSLLIEPL